MDLTTYEVRSLLEMKKYPIDAIRIDFPTHGEFIEVEIQNENARFKFQADVNRVNKLTDKLTFQLRHKKTYSLRRLDFNGNHRNPPAPAPDKIFKGYENATFLGEAHLHFYVEGYGERWALPLTAIKELNILPQDDIYEKMLKFFKYCQVENLTFKITKNLLF